MFKNLSIKCVSKIQTVKSGFMGNLKDLNAQTP